MKANWKLIETEKPKHGEKVLIVSEYKGEVRMVTAIYKNEKFMAFNWFTEELDEAKEFTHWAPWPPPPKPNN